MYLAFVSCGCTLRGRIGWRDCRLSGGHSEEEGRGRYLAYVDWLLRLDGEHSVEGCVRYVGWVYLVRRLCAESTVKARVEAMLESPAVESMGESGVE